MGLIIDAREAYNPQKAGKGIYSYSIIEQLKFELQDDQVTLLSNCPISDKLPRSWSVKIIKGGGIWWQIKASIFLHNHPEDILFSPISYLLPYLSPNRALITVHDLISFVYPYGHNLKATLIERFCLPKLFKRSNAKFLTVSVSTKNDLLKISKNKINSNNIFVTPAALSAEFKEIKKSKKIRKNPQMILTVGTLVPRKNLTTLISAFSEMLLNNEELKDFTLHIVGAKNWKNSDLAQVIKKSDFKNNIIFHGYITNEEMHELYQEATFFVLPSLYEGFGLPLLEAMQTKCAILASDRSSLPEVAADAAIYCNPYSKTDLANKLYYLLKNRELQQELVKNGIERVKDFDWSESGQTIRKLYKDSRLS